MPAFAYRVRDKEGKKIKGVIEAGSEKMAADRLSSEGYLVTTIRPARSLPLWAEHSVGVSRISADDLTMFFFQLGNMVEAGVGLLSALESVVEQIGSRKMKHIVHNLIVRVQEGASFSEAMNAHPKTFPLLYRSMIRVGETSGGLAEVLRYAAELNEARTELRDQVRSALAYPVVLICASIAVVTFMMVWIVPTFTAIFNKAGVPLPLPTRLIYGTSMAIRAHPLVLVGIVAFVVFGFPILLRWPTIKYAWDRLWLSVPGIGLLIKRVEVARWARSMGLMLSSGVPILQALEIALDLTQNSLFRAALNDAYTDIQSGGKLADTLLKNSVFPNDVIQMTSTGENSGTLDKMLYKIANFYDRLITRTLKKMTSMIEPIFILLMGSIVAFIMLSILLPIFDMIKLFNVH